MKLYCSRCTTLPLALPGLTGILPCVSVIRQLLRRILLTSTDIGTPHSAFQWKDAPAEAVPRKSMEIRAIIFS
jgi:hypothetical protein